MAYDRSSLQLAQEQPEPAAPPEEEPALPERTMLEPAAIQPNASEALPDDQSNGSGCGVVDPHDPFADTTFSEQLILEEDAKADLLGVGAQAKAPH